VFQTYERTSSHVPEAPSCRLKFGELGGRPTETRDFSRVGGSERGKERIDGVYPRQGMCFRCLGLMGLALTK